MKNMAEKDNFDDELAIGTSTERNWRGILIALLVIIIVLALIVTSVILLTPPDDGPRVKGRRLEIADLLRPDLRPKVQFNGSWISDHELIFQDYWGGISIMNVSSLKIWTIMSNHTFSQLQPEKYSLSTDHKYLLLAQNVHKINRFTSEAQYSIFDIETSDIWPVHHLLQKSSEHVYLSYAQWSPRHNGLILVQNCNIFYKPSLKSNGYQLTNTGVPLIISNGVPDWLYEEEILHSDNAIWVSDDGYLIIYAAFNDTLVNELIYPIYRADISDFSYPKVGKVRYPRAGAINPEVTLHVIDLTNIDNIEIKNIYPPTSFDVTSGFYFTSVTWISSTEISIVWINRVQNLSIISICKSPTWICFETYKTEIVAENLGWATPPNQPIFSHDKLSYITVSSVRIDDSEFYRHIVSVNIPKKRILPLTHGKFEVVDILAWDHSNDVIYFSAIPEKKPGQKHIYRVTSVPPRLGASLMDPLCITCSVNILPPIPPYYGLGTAGSMPKQHSRYWNTDWNFEDTTLSSTPPTKFQKKKKHMHSVYHNTQSDKELVSKLIQQCLYYTAKFSPKSVEYFILECHGPIIPFITLHKTEIPKPKFLMHLENNTKIQQVVAKLAMPQVKTFPVQISGGFHAQVRLMLPPGLREDEITTYPLIVQIYDGPGSQLITEQWRIDYNSYLACKNDYIIAQIDGRGSGGQGQKLLHEVYHTVGTVEVSDQLEVTEYLGDSLHFIDKHRIAVWGRNYGGFIALTSLAMIRSMFKCAVALSPITDWRLYNSVYSERYMGSPNVTGNYKGYEEADLKKKASHFKDKMLYLVHGTADKNVHLQQSMLLTKELTEHGILFRQQIYADEDNSLRNVQEHLYKSIDEFLNDCFDKQLLLLNTEEKSEVSEQKSSSK